MEQKLGRPRKYTDATRVCVRARGTSRLQTHSDRRAIIDALVEAGGCMTLEAVDKHFG